MPWAEVETYISVDVETSGPNPSTYSLLSIGACVAFEPTRTFYVELQPETDASTPEAMAVSGLDLDRLKAEGVAPRAAMRMFEEWLESVTPEGRQPVFLGFNAAFDWMFVADSFHRLLGRNPFGHDALDIEALYMGATGTPWREIKFSALVDRYQIEQRVLTHNALDDALVQAELFRRVLDQLSGEDR